jgi:hypothetical protein
MLVAMPVGLTAFLIGFSLEASSKIKFHAKSIIIQLLLAALNNTANKQVLDDGGIILASFFSAFLSAAFI